MILTAIELENFRQFRGTQRLELSTSPDRNVTVVYGANGAGKTSLLNAFTWALYRACSPGFEQPDHLINEQAWAEAQPGDDVAATVTLEFEHEGRRYSVRRTTVDRKNTEGAASRVKDAVVSVGFIDEDGEHHNRDDTSAGTINEVLPERLHRFFFFDGERIEQLVKPDAYAEIEQAIKGILGLQVVENAIKHTDEARKDLERELRDLGTDEDRALADELAQVRTKRDERRETVAQHRRNLTALEDERQVVGDRLAQLAEAATLQHEREELERDLEESEKSIRASRTSLSDHIARKGWLAFAAGLAQQTSAVFEERRERGEIPSDLKRQFVEDLLERGRCICGCELTPDTDPYSLVAEWRERAVHADVEAAWTRLPALAEGTLTRRKELYSYLHETLAELSRHREGRKRIVDKLSAISDSLRHGDSDTVKELEEQRERIGASITEQQRLLARAEVEIEGLDERERTLERELEKARAENERAEIARRRVSVARSGASIFREILDLRTEEVREQLDRRIKDLYSKISFKAYVPLLDASFRLDLRNAEGQRSASVAKSTGENQILSLTFVGALAEHARDRYDEAQRDGGDGLLTFQGGVYPVVMDSPFGSLDLNYQQRVAEAIPHLAPQVVVFVSQSQGLGAVQEQMGPRISREYVIDFHTPKEDLEVETITLRSGAYPYISRSTAGERAELIPVRTTP
ncbi:MAG: AAA family ATPase [Solirubrobacteraceae bacterium MAG38_C4-C5]|nr:AAA family ATPase [Candidatus Siliceabacter maunaloa]